MLKENNTKKINLSNQIIKNRIKISIIGISLFLFSIILHAGLVESAERTFSPASGFFYLILILPLEIIGSVLASIGLIFLFIQLKGKRVITRTIPILIIILLLWEVSGLFSGQQYQQSIALYTNNSFFCKTTFFSFLYQTHSIDYGCYKKIAQNKEDSNICAKIAEEHIRNECYKNIAITVKDERICENISHELAYSFPFNAMKNYCYYAIAKETKNESICEKITEKYTKIECYKNIAITVDQSICENIPYDELSYNRMGWPSYSMRDDCYYDVAIKTKNESICRKISIKSEEYIKTGENSWTWRPTEEGCLKKLQSLR